MSFSVKILIPGRVSGKGRPKFSTRGGFARAYTPVATRNMEAMVRDLGDRAMAGRSLLEGPLGVSIYVTQLPTASWSKKRQAAAKWVTGKPDVDNVAKLIGDALNGIVWRDDAQIAGLHFQRRYSRTQRESVEVCVYELDKGGDWLLRTEEELKLTA